MKVIIYINMLDIYVMIKDTHINYRIGRLTIIKVIVVGIIY